MSSGAEAPLAALGVARIPVPVPFLDAGGPVNVYLIDEPDGSLTLFDSGLGTAEALRALREGFERLGRRFSEVKRVLVSHGHVDHFGLARTFQEEAGAQVYVHPLDRAKVEEISLSAELKVHYRRYFARLGMSAEIAEQLVGLQDGNKRFSRQVPHTLPLAEGDLFAFKNFNGRILHMPGHTPGLVCLWAEQHRVLFADDHLLARISPNPLIELGPRGEENKFPALISYLESARRVHQMDVDWVLPGHGPPFQGHRKLLEGLFSFYERRQQKILAILQQGPQTAAQVLKELFGEAGSFALFLMLSEVVGNLELLEQQGRVNRALVDGSYRFSAA